MFPGSYDTNCVEAATQSLRAGGIYVDDVDWHSLGSKNPSALRRSLDNKAKEKNSRVIKVW